VNPARSLGPALVIGGTPLSQVWLFIVAPLIGGAIAASLYYLVYPAHRRTLLSHHEAFDHEPPAGRPEPEPGRAVPEPRRAEPVLERAVYGRRSWTVRI
jgi:hypothetical protein